MGDTSLPSESLIQAYRDLNLEFMDMVGSLSVLRSLSTLSLAGLTEAQLIAKALEVLMLNQDLERCSVFLLEEGRLVNAGGKDWDDLIGARRAGDSPECRCFALNEGLIGIAAATGELQHSRDCLQDPRFVAPDHGKAAGVGSLIAVPVRANGETIGVLNVSHPHTRFFSVGHERALAVFANFLGQMIVTRRLLTQMDNLVKERTGDLQQALNDAVALKRRYAEMSTVDELTGLHNRRHFFPAARQALAGALRNGTPFSVILLDLDYFKQLNDTYGHAGGDQALTQFAAVLRDECREADLLARFGGEEFILALPGTDAAGAAMVAERIRVAAKAWRGQMPGGTMRMSVTLGISCLAEKGEAEHAAHAVLERLIREADQALYFGKESGRDQYRLFQDIACSL
jgi:diguanylate cyclase (GGDEF)-like protein